MYADVDGDGRTLFSELKTDSTGHGLIQYGWTAFGFDDSGEISSAVHYPVIRQFCFDPGFPEEGKALLEGAMAALDAGERVYAFFHYFGMSACGRHGKLHEKDSHAEALLMENGFVVEHENVYYSRVLTQQNNISGKVSISWRDLSPGGCREFAAADDGQEFSGARSIFFPRGISPTCGGSMWTKPDSTRAWGSKQCTPYSRSCSIWARSCSIWASGSSTRIPR